MYGGYGNIWNQGSTQWPTANVPNQIPIQNQQNVAQQFQVPQQNVLGYGGNLTGVANPAMGWGVGGANPFMNYGGNTAGFGLPTTTPSAASWIGNQQFQIHQAQAFPGGRPPLPPGPPPQDDKSNQIQLGAQNTQVPPPPSSFPSNVLNQQRAPPPPPPPPPSQPPPHQKAHIFTNVSGGQRADSRKTMSLEDAYNIIKNVPAYAMLANSGPLNTLASLNVSEELFGSKTCNQGIPGLDMVDEDKLITPAGPEVVDLEKEVEKFNQQISSVSSSINNSSVQNSGSSTSLIKNETNRDKMDDKIEKGTSKYSSTSMEPNKIVWELRSDTKPKGWTMTQSTSNGEGTGSKGNNIWRTKEQAERPSSGLKTSSTPETNDAMDTIGKVDENQSYFNDKTNSTESNSNEEKNGVRIHLESVDGKELVYDRKILKQFDQKFREWENQFDNWKRSNQNHPDQNAYTQYLDQWNNWREQLIEQRRSILDKMTKAKIDSKEILMAKFESLDHDDQVSEVGSVGASSSHSQSRDVFPLKDDPQLKLNDKGPENPFEAALRTTEGGRKPAPPPPAAPIISSLRDQEQIEKSTKAGIPPLIPGLESKNRTVERVLRAGGGGKSRNENNIFGNDFGQNQSGKNPFVMDSPYEDNPLSDRNKNSLQQRPDRGQDSLQQRPDRNQESLQQRPDRNQDSLQQRPDRNQDSLQQRADRNQDSLQQRADRNQDSLQQRADRNQDSLQQRADRNQDSLQQRADRNQDSLQQRADRNQDSLQQRKNQGESKFDSDSVRIPFSWSLPSQNKDEKNPFDMAQSSDNPFMQPSGPNPFEMKTEPKLPSLDDFIKRTNLNFSAPPTSSSIQMQSANPFAMTSKATVESQNKTRIEFERIPRDPQGNQPQMSTSSTPNKSLRLEANPTGFPLLVASKDGSPPPKREMDEISNLFSRDRGPCAATENFFNTSCSVDMDDDFVEDADVIDYGGGGNSVDSMDLPRGEKQFADNEEDGDGDFSLEDSEVIDYSQSIPPHEAELRQYSGPGPESYGGRGGYSEEFGPYPPFYEAGQRGRGRGHPAWLRGHPRGPPPGHPFGRGAPETQYPHDFIVPSRGRGFPRDGVGRGMRGPAPQQEWFQQDERDLGSSAGGGRGDEPDVIVLSPSPEPKVVPGIKIAPPNPEFERGERRRSRSRERYSRDRSRSRSRERVSRRGRDEPERREDASRRDRDRRSSPDRRGRYDDRDQRRDRDRFRDRDRRGRSKSRSRSPVEDRTPVVRSPLFPSASAGMLSSHPASNPPPPRYQTVLVEDILNMPGREKRPSRLVIFMRGLPGSGKSHIVKLIKEREVEMGGKAPRILSLDNYFITEMEKKEKDPVTGVEVKKTVMEYEYDEEREPLYRAQLVRQFKKTLEEGYFSFVIVDCVNEYVRQFEDMATVATQKRFQVYVSEIEESVDICVKRNVHKRTKDEIQKISKSWERTPSNFIKLDMRTLLQDEAVQEVEMEDVSDVDADSNEQKAPTPAERGKIGPQVVDLEDIEDENSGDHHQASKWDSLEPSQEKLNKLDGLMKRKRGTSEEKQVESAPSIENWLTTGNMPEEYMCNRPIQPGQKRVRWADIEAKREQERMREMGFVVGQTDWNKMMDPSGGSSALCRTKFI